MGAERAAARRRCTERRRLRRAVLWLGRLLGWPTPDIMAFTEAQVGRPWRRCGCSEFEAVLEEYRALAGAIRARNERRATGPKRRLGGSHVSDL